MWTVFLSLLAALSACGPSPGGEPALEEVLSHWAILEEAGSHLDVRFTLRHPPSSKGTQPLPQTGRFLLEGDSAWVRVMAYTARQPQSEIVVGKNARYAYTLSRPNPNAPFLVTYLGKPDAELDRQLFQRMNDHYGCTVPWSAQWKPLRLWLKEPGFSLRRLHEEQQGGKRVVLLDCTYQPPPESGKNYWFSRMTVRLDPAHHYRVNSYDADIESGGVSARIEYAADADDLPVPVRNTITFTYRGQTRAPSVWVCDYHEWKYRTEPVTDAALGLSAFDLPEPAATRPAERARTWMGLMAAALVLAALAILFARLKSAAAARR